MVRPKLRNENIADTGYWIALLDPQDTLHQNFVKLSISLAQAEICTSEMIMTEVLNHFSKRGSFIRQAAIALIQSAQNRIVLRSRLFHKSVNMKSKLEVEEGLQNYQQPNNPIPAVR